MAKYIDAERFVEYFGDWYTEEGTELGYVGPIKDLVFLMPAADVEPQWIPVTERLPEEEGQYLVSCDTDYGVEVARFYIDEDGERYFGCDWNNPEDIEAWMPLPTPYKGGEEE